MGLYEKMFNVMNESKAIEKSMTVGKGTNSYQAISESAVLGEIKPLLKAYKLILFPVDVKVEETHEAFEGKYGETQRFNSVVHATYKIVDTETSEFELLQTVGYGSDTQDKGSGKAMTYAYKALLQKTFMLFSGEDTDNTHSEDIGNTGSTKSDVKVTTQMLSDAIKAFGKDDKWAIDNYNKQHNKNITDLKFMAQDSKQAVYKYLKEQKK
jgi:hypothetical protein